MTSLQVLWPRAQPGSPDACGQTEVPWKVLCLSAWPSEQGRPLQNRPASTPTPGTTTPSRAWGQGRSCVVGLAAVLFSPLTQQNRRRPHWWRHGRNGRGGPKEPPEVGAAALMVTTGSLFLPLLIPISPNQKLKNHRVNQNKSLKEKKKRRVEKREKKEETPKP